MNLRGKAFAPSAGHQVSLHIILQSASVLSQWDSFWKSPCSFATANCILYANYFLYCTYNYENPNKLTTVYFKNDFIFNTVAYWKLCWKGNKLCHMWIANDQSKRCYCILSKEKKRERKKKKSLPVCLNRSSISTKIHFRTHNVASSITNKCMGHILSTPF